MTQAVVRTLGDLYHLAHAWKILGGELARETPDRRARERNQANIQQWGTARQL